jgi:predicted amidophosphoribosyltransferase
VAIGVYAGVAGQAVRALKFSGRRSLARTLGGRLALVIGALPIRPDAVVAVPANPWRRLRRGHDPALALARAVADALGLPVWRSLERRRHGRPQSAAPDRRSNVRGAFVARGTLAGANLLLVDDVITSGATALEAALALRQAGAVRVWVAAAAHSRPGRAG